MNVLRWLLLVVPLFVCESSNAQGDSLYLKHRAQILSPQESDALRESYNYFESQVSQHLATGDTLSAVRDLRLIAIGQNALGMFDSCEQTCVMAIDLLKNQPLNEKVLGSLTGLNNQLGLMYRTQQHYDISMLYYERALTYSLRRSDSLTILNNIGLNYLDMRQYTQAERYFNLTLSLSSPTNNVKNYHRVLSNVGHAQGKQDKPGALINLEASLAGRKLDLDSKGTYSSYQHLTDYYLDRQDLKKARAYADSALQTARSFNSLSYIEDALKRVLRASGEEIPIEFVRLSDSLENMNRSSQNRFAAMAYDFQAQQRLAAENALLAERQKASKVFFIYVAILLVLLGTGLYLVLKSRHRKRQQLQIYRTETRISKRVHDEVANDLYILMAQSQSKTSKPEDWIDQLDKIYAKTRDISREIGSLEVDQDFGNVLKAMLASYSTEHIHLIIQGWNSVDWERLTQLERITLYRVLQELMTNMKKHSHASTVIVSINQDTEKLTVSYTDNGVGTYLKRSGGLRNVETRMAGIRGTIRFETAPENGFRAELKI